MWGFERTAGAEEKKKRVQRARESDSESVMAMTQSDILPQTYPKSGNFVSYISLTPHLSVNLLFRSFRQLLKNKL